MTDPRSMMHRTLSSDPRRAAAISAQGLRAMVSPPEIGGAPMVKLFDQLAGNHSMVRRRLQLRERLDRARGVTRARIRLQR